MEKVRVAPEEVQRGEIIAKIFSNDFVSEDIFIASQKAAEEIIESPLESDPFAAGYYAVLHLEASHPEEVAKAPEAMAARVAETVLFVTMLKEGGTMNRYKRTRVHEAFSRYLTTRETVFEAQAAD